MSDNNGASGPLLPRGGSFPQQGQIDWVTLSKSTVEFTVETLSRISKAGVEALTLYAAKAIFCQVELDAVGEERILDALGKAGAFSSANNALWFGFGSKSTVRTLSESSQGLACIGICSCLTEEFSSDISAKILRELFLLYRPPLELTPSIRQWLSLVDACSGVLASTNFGHTVHGLSRLYLADGLPNLRSSSTPESIAKVLKELFEVSTGNIAQVHISGGIDCAWVASIAHWLLGLSVAVENESRDVVFRKDSRKPGTVQDVQVFICYGSGSTEAASLVHRTYVVPSGRLLISDVYTIPEDDVLSHGRLSWSTCLCDTFGNPMRMLLTSLAPHSGACLGSAARIYEHVSCDTDLTILPRATYGASLLLPGPGSFGRGFFLLARDTFPELHEMDSLLRNMERILDKPVETAIKEYSESINSIRMQCRCTHCCPTDNEEQRGYGDRFCMVVLIHFICHLVRLLSQVAFQKDLPISPTLTGMERLYLHRRYQLNFRQRKQSRTADPVLELVGGGQPSLCLLQTVQILFTGRAPRSDHEGGVSSASAVATGGVCIFYRVLCEVSAKPDRACQMYIVPGKIQWNSALYDRVLDTRKDLYDDPQSFEYSTLDSRWSSSEVSTITSYDNLSDSSSEDLDAKLLIEEASSWTQSIRATWSISCSKGVYRIGPVGLTTQLMLAWVGKNCHGQTCSSLNGFRGILVRGEGKLRADQLGIDEHGDVQDPIIRVLTRNDATVWVVLAEGYLRTPKYGPQYRGTGFDRGIRFLFCLQGEQCVRCCVTNTIMRDTRLDNDCNARVCILTSI